MKQTKRMQLKIAAGLVICLMIGLLTACKDASQEDTHTVKIVIVDSSDYIVNDAAVFVEKGGDANFIVSFCQGYTYGETDYMGECEAVRYSDALYRLTFKEVAYPTRVRIHTVKAEQSGVIRYDANGGQFKTGQVSKESTYTKDGHIRINTLSGAEVEQWDGHTLIGWNTSPDGSGTHIGLGSRMSISGDAEVYAEWREWTPKHEFEFAETSDGVTLTAYHGYGSEVVIPAFYGEKPVTDIAADAFKQAHIDTVILPNTIQRISAGAFNACSIQELYLFDNVEEISDECFHDCVDLRTVHMNAYLAPVYTDRTQNCNFADKYDILIEHSKERKLVIFSGCSSWYNIDCRRLYEEVEGYYPVNLGVNGALCGVAQFEMLVPYLQEGDIVLHSPEIGNPQQYFASYLSENFTGIWPYDPDRYDCYRYFEMTKTTWQAVELNYDLMALVDLQSVEKVFGAFMEYQQEKRLLDAGSYQDDPGYVSEFGGYAGKHSYSNGQLDYGDGNGLHASFFEGNHFWRMSTMYHLAVEKGAKVYVSFSAYNIDAAGFDLRDEALDEATLYTEKAELLAKSSGAVLISTLSDYLYEKEFFYDSNYHLTEEGQEVNTERLLRDLTAQMQADGSLFADHTQG